MAAQRRLASAVNASSPLRSLLSFLVIGLLLVGLICPLPGGNHGLDLCFSAIVLFSYLISAVSCGSYFTPDASGYVLDSYLRTAPDRAPPPNQTIPSI